MNNSSKFLLKPLPFTVLFYFYHSLWQKKNTKKITKVVLSVLFRTNKSIPSLKTLMRLAVGFGLSK